MGAREDFEDQLKALGFQPLARQDGRVSFPYSIPVGRFAGTDVTLGVEVPVDFPRTPPSGPHFTPRLQPINPGAAAHPDRAHESPFGPEWQYWSRPYPGWGRDGRSVASYMAFVRHLFATA